MNINMSLLGSYALAPQSAYLWVKDAELNDTGWVQTGTWNPPGGGPAVVSGTPANPAGSPQSFAFVGSDPDGYSNIYRVYFLMNSNATIPPYSCHGFYDRPSNAFYLYNDAVTVALGPLTPGSSGTLANSQCQINGNSSAPAAGSGNNLTVNINMSLLGSYALAAQNVYVWVKDAQNNDTGWVQSGTWNPPAGSQPPSIPSVSPNTSLTTAQTFTVTARDTDGANNIYRLYFQVGPDATVTPNGCHGFYDRPSHTLFLHSDAMTLTGPITPGTASTLSNSQCTVLANSTSIVSSSGTDFVLSIGLAVQGAYSQLYRKVYFWAKDNQGNDSGWDSLGVSWTATFNAFRNCVTATTAATCTIPPATHTISQTIPLTRSNVTVRGGGSLRTDTKLLRDANFTSPLIQVDATGSLTNVVIENLTVCGGSGLPYSEGQAPVSSPVGCTRHASPLCQSLNNCIDLDIRNSNTGAYHTNPFANTGPYSVTVNNVDFEDSTGHAIGMYVGQTFLRANDVYIHHSAINFSAITGILYHGHVQYSSTACDSSPTNFANDQNVTLPRNIRIENNTFYGNRTGAMGGGARWVGLRNNTFTNNYTNPQAGNVGGGTIEFDECSDQVEISNNGFTAPSGSTYYTETVGLELYARNLTVSGNTVTGYPLEGMSLSSVSNAQVTGNTVTNNALLGLSRGGILVTTAPPLSGACGDTRETTGVLISGNTSTGQHFGIQFADLYPASTNRIHGVTLTNNNSLFPNSITPVTRDKGVVVNGSFNNWTVVENQDILVRPRALAVKAISPLTNRCSTPGNTLQTFSFPAADSSGPGNLAWIPGMFSISGDDATGLGGPDYGAQGCHFIYFPASNVIYLDGASGGNNWVDSSWVGSGGRSITNGYCTIHAGSAGSQVTYETYIANLQLSVGFPSSSTSSLKKHIYNISGDQQGRLSKLGLWSYWGWWSTP